MHGWESHRIVSLSHMIHLYNNNNHLLFYFFLSFFCFHTAPATEYDAGFDGISSAEMYDLDAEQSQARYDPRVLSKELSGSHSPGSRETENGAYCMNANERYEHGQKVWCSLVARLPVHPLALLLSLLIINHTRHSLSEITRYTRRQPSNQRAVWPRVRHYPLPLPPISPTPFTSLYFSTKPFPFIAFTLFPLFRLFIQASGSKTIHSYFMFVFFSPHNNRWQISRTDPCEICLCVDGEVFCWWKKCGK